MPTENVYEQLTFAQYIEGIQPKEETKPPTVVKSKKPQLPEILKNIDTRTVESFLKSVGKKGFYTILYNNDLHRYERAVYNFTSNTGTRDYTTTTKDYIFIRNLTNRSFPVRTIVYFDNDGNCWSNTLTIKHCNNSTKSRQELASIEFDKWKLSQKMHNDPIFIQSEDELGEIVKVLNPYAFEFCIQNRCNFSAYLMAPQLEILYKAGFSFSGLLFRLRDTGETAHYPHRNIENKIVDNFNRLCKKGKSPKEIFKTSKAVYTVLKNERNLSVWDNIRKLDKFGRIKQDAIQQVYDMNFNEDDLKKLNEILNKTYDGKPVFTFNRLVNYLQRLDMYEAIDRREAFMLLKDYLTMCNQLNQEPKLDGDSLKREHDVTARTVRQHRNEILAKEVQSACDRLQKYNYSDGKYFIRGVQNYDDLINEATQQHNCVASYAASIKKGSSLIYFLREVNSPNRSLVTVEINATKDKIRQAYRAYNQPVRDSTISDFLQNWLEHIQAVDNGLVSEQKLDFLQTSANTQTAPILPNEITGAGMTQNM